MDTHSTFYVKSLQEFLEAMYTLKDVCHLPPDDKLTFWYFQETEGKVEQNIKYSSAVLLPKAPTEGYYNHFVGVYFV